VKWKAAPENPDKQAILELATRSAAPISGNNISETASDSNSSSPNPEPLQLLVTFDEEHGGFMTRVEGARPRIYDEKTIDEAAHWVGIYSNYRYIDEQHMWIPTHMESGYVEDQTRDGGTDDDDNDVTFYVRLENVELDYRV